MIKRLREIDKSFEEGQISTDLLKEILEVTSIFRKMEIKANEDNAQKFKNRWCLEGDENSALFHKSINRKKHINSIKGIKIEGRWEVDPERVKNHFKNYYEGCFTADPECNWEQDLDNPSRLTQSDKADLEKKF